MFKKEYLILFAIIIGACLYLYLKDRDRINYQLPEPAAIEKSRIEKIDIQRPQSAVISLTKVGGDWRIGAKGYAADEAQAKRMTDALADITLTALVSDAGDYDRYDLTDDSAVIVTARSGDDKELRKLVVGKKAASGNHTFVRIGDDPSVYHAGGSLHDLFDQTVDALRDKTVLSFDKESIDRISITQAGRTLTLEKETAAPTSPDEQAASGDDTAAGDKAAVWKTDDDRPVDQAAVETLLDALASLKCKGYLPEGAEKALTDPEYRIVLTGKPATMTLSLFPLAGEDTPGYAGLSSENPSAFTLPQYQAERVMKKPSDLLTGAAD